MNRTLPALPVVLLLVLSACASSGGSPDTGGGSAPPSASPGDGGQETGEIEHPTGAAEPILVVAHEGGFVMMDMVAMQLPSFVLLGDGRVIRPGLQTLQYPGPALPPVQERTLTEEGIQIVLAAAEDTNLFTGAELRLDGMRNSVADAPDTVFTLEAGGLSSRVAVYGLGTYSGGPELPPGVERAELEAHRALMRLNETLTMLDALPAEAWATDGWVLHEPEALRLHLIDVTGQPVEGGDLPTDVRDWPTDEDPAQLGEEAPAFRDGTRCVVVEGDAARTWLAELSEANQLTPWTTDGDDRWRVLPRPLLPHEERTCPDPGGSR